MRRERRFKIKKFPYIEVVVPGPLKNLFTYSVPQRLQEKTLPGCRVIVPFGTKTIVGLVVGRLEKSDVKTKEILQVVDDELAMPKDSIELLLWAARHYFAGPGEVFNIAVPKVDIKIDQILKLVEGASIEDAGSGRLKELFQLLSDNGGSRKLDLVRKSLQLDLKQINRLISTDKGKKLVAKQFEVRKVKTRNVETVNEPLPEASLPKPTDQQKRAIDSLKSDIEAKKFKVNLLHGVTGSGKTEVYAHLAKHTLDSGKSVLVMAPEIALADMLAERLRKRLGVEPVTLHSDMTPRQRAIRWREALSNEPRLVIGARSAVFAPMGKKPGLIIVDEEHDPSYKQETAPRYNGRDVAVKRASLLDIPILLGSATPSLESYYNTTTGRYNLLELTERIDNRPMPKIVMVEPETPGRIGEKLGAQIEKRLEDGDQTLLFINRRGAARYLMCGRCGHTFECKNCSISLVYHASAKKLECHTCGYAEGKPASCPDCGETSMVGGGSGSEKIEQDILGKFPNARIARMDRDTTTKRGGASKILTMVEKGAIDILVGTQMITKGHDLPNVTLVGAISADDSMSIPDFRASERTFQLITQAAGRAGRGDKEGFVVVQSVAKSGYALEAALTHDYGAFYKHEISIRNIAGYPPFVRLAAVKIEAASESGGKSVVDALEGKIGYIAKKYDGLEILGPVEAVIFRVRNRYHWRILCKASNHSILSSGINELLNAAEPLSKNARGAVRFIVDIDPATTL